MIKTGSIKCIKLFNNDDFYNGDTNFIAYSKSNQIIKFLEIPNLSNYRRTTIFKYLRSA